MSNITFPITLVIIFLFFKCCSSEIPDYDYDSLGDDLYLRGVHKYTPKERKALRKVVLSLIEISVGNILCI